MSINATRRLLIGAPLLLSAAALSGCMSSPTYGTGKTANMQLMEDLTSIVSPGGKDDGPPIAYTPRPELVKPAGTQVALIAPQDSLNAAGNPAWPESPERRLARIRAEATENQDNPSYRSPVVVDTPSAATGKGLRNVDPERQGAEKMINSRGEFKRRMAEQQGSAASRKYLSEPPLVYRAAEATAPTGDVGEDEWKKERKNKKAARKKGSGLFGGLSDILPW